MNQATGWATAAAPLRQVSLKRVLCIGIQSSRLKSLPGLWVVTRCHWSFCFFSPGEQVERIYADAVRAFAPAPVIGCTTAGELADCGYSEDQIVAIGFPSSHFLTRTLAGARS